MALSDFTKFGQTTHISVSNLRSNSAPQSIQLLGSTYSNGSNSQLKGLVLDQTLTDSPAEGRVNSQFYVSDTGSVYHQSGFVFRYQDIDNFYWAVHNGEGFDEGYGVGKVSSGTVEVLIESDEGLSVAGDQWQTLNGEGFENSSGEFVVRLEGPGSSIEAADPANEFSGGGGIGLVQGGNGNEGFTSLLQSTFTQTETIGEYDDIEINF